MQGGRSNICSRDLCRHPSFFFCTPPMFPISQKECIQPKHCWSTPRLNACIHENARKEGAHAYMFIRHLYQHGLVRLKFRTSRLHTSACTHPIWSLSFFHTFQCPNIHCRKESPTTSYISEKERCFPRHYKCPRCFTKLTRRVWNSVVKADFLKAVSKRLIRLLYVVNRMNDCFKMRKTSVRLRTLNFF